MRVQSLDQEDPLEEGMATHSSILAWRTPMDGGAWRAIVHRVAESDMTEVTWHAVSDKITPRLHSQVRHNKVTS